MDWKPAECQIYNFLCHLGSYDPLASNSLKPGPAHSGILKNLSKFVSSKENVETSFERILKFLKPGQ